VQHEHFAVSRAKNCELGVEPLQLIAVGSRRDRVISWQQLVMNDAFGIPPNRQHHLLRVQVTLRLRLRLFILVDPLPFPGMVDIETPLLIAGHHLVQPVEAATF